MNPTDPDSDPDPQHWEVSSNPMLRIRIRWDFLARSDPDPVHIPCLLFSFVGKFGRTIMLSFHFQ
jgi:hypothetical protein